MYNIYLSNISRVESWSNSYRKYLNICINFPDIQRLNLKILEVDMELWSHLDCAADVQFFMMHKISNTWPMFSKIHGQCIRQYMANIFENRLPMYSCQ